MSVQLSAREWQLLRFAMGFQSDWLLSDLVLASQDKDWWEKSRFLKNVMPPRFREFYSAAFVRRFVVSALNFFARLDALPLGPDRTIDARADNETLTGVTACVADELMFRGLIESLGLCYEMFVDYYKTKKMAPALPKDMEDRFEEFWANHIVDEDAQFLFDDDTAWLGDESATLHPAGWFTSFDHDRVHPYCENPPKRLAPI